MTKSLLNNMRWSESWEAVQRIVEGVFPDLKTRQKVIGTALEIAGAPEIKTPRLISFRSFLKSDEKAKDIQLICIEQFPDHREAVVYSFFNEAPFWRVTRPRHDPDHSIDVAAKMEAHGVR